MIATAGRVLHQLRHDPRTIGLLVGVPSVLLVLLRYTFNSAERFSEIVPALLGIFPFLLMFVVASISTLRERTSGTLERLMTMPMPKFSLMAGYALAFGAVAVVQVAVATTVGLLLGMTVEGSIVWIVVVMLIDAVLGVTLGLFASAFATTEFQAIQLMPVVVLPQLLLCGLFVPRDQMAPFLQWISDVLPVTYAVEALQKVASGAAVDGEFFRDVAILLAWVVGAVVLGAATLRRQTR